MNIIVAIIFGLKRASECIKIMHHFEGEHAKILQYCTATCAVWTPVLYVRRRLWCLHSSAFDTLSLQSTFLDTGVLDSVVVPWSVVRLSEVGVHWSHSVEIFRGAPDPIF